MISAHILTFLQELEAAWSRRDHNGFLQQDCHTPLLPVGFVLKLVIWSSWGDPFYVGLSGLEVYDAASGLVNIDATRMSAEPFASVASLPNMSGDARTLDKLVCTCFPMLHFVYYVTAPSCWATCV
jgi:hypothetical protein